MNRTSLITQILLAPPSLFNTITYANGIPEPASREAYFDEVPIVLERAELRETEQDGDQGRLIAVDARANIHRDSDFLDTFKHEFVLIYIETANGEQHFFGSLAHPVKMEYSKTSGASNADNRETTLTFSIQYPK
jgi:hypothetical protein